MTREHQTKMSDSEIFGWLIFGGLAIAIIWLLTRNRSVSAAISGCAIGSHPFGSQPDDLTNFGPLNIGVCVPDLPTGTVDVSQVVTSPGPFQGTQVPGVSSQPGNHAMESNGCWDPQLYASKLYPQEEVISVNGTPRLVFHGAGVGGTDLFYPGCPNEVLRLRP